MTKYSQAAVSNRVLVWHRFTLARSVCVHGEPIAFPLAAPEMSPTGHLPRRHTSSPPGSLSSLVLAFRPNLPVARRTRRDGKRPPAPSAQSLRGAGVVHSHAPYFQRGAAEAEYLSGSRTVESEGFSERAAVESGGLFERRAAESAARERLTSTPELQLAADVDPALHGVAPSDALRICTPEPARVPARPPRSGRKMPLTKIGRYRLTDVLGVGMFSRVVVGVDDATGEAYAVKVMNKRRLEELNMDQYARREALVMHRVRHANIVEFVEAIQSPKKLFLVMRIVPGLELLDVVAAGPLTETDAKHYMKQLVDAVAHLHASGYCHRDIKPENVLIDVRARRLVLIDLGLSGIIRRYSPMLTTCGSAHYSAPETTFGSHAGYDGVKSDAWSCGVLAFIMLTGAHPFVDGDGDLMHDNLRTARVEYPVNLSSCAVSFVSCLLTLAPRKRHSVAQARNHPWLNPVPFDQKRPRPSLDYRQAGGRVSGTASSFAKMFPRASMATNASEKGESGATAPKVFDDELRRRRSKGSTSSFSWFKRAPMNNGELAEDDESRGSFLPRWQRKQWDTEYGEDDPQHRSSSLIGLTAQAINSFASSIGIDRDRDRDRERERDRDRQPKMEEPAKRAHRRSQDGGRVGRHMSFTFKRGVFTSRKHPG